MGGQAEEQEQKLCVDFQKAQYSLLHVLSENFGMHNKQIIADHDPVQLVEKLKAKHTVESPVPGRQRTRAWWKELELLHRLGSELNRTV